MPEYCPACKNEILPYLKTGEFKQIHLEYLVSYQFYFCIHCKKVYKEIHEKYPITDLIKEEPIAKDTGKVSNIVSKKGGK